MRHLTQRRVDALKPRKTAYEVRDGELKGFGVRVGASGKKSYFLHSQCNGRRIWKILGGVETVSADEAPVSRDSGLVRDQARNTPAGETAFEVVAEEVFRRYGRRWKTGTLAVNRINYRSKILPWFKGKSIADIGKEDVRQFASLRETPAAADRSIPILSVIMRQAEFYGYRPEDSNPCKGHQAVWPRRSRTLPVGGGNQPSGCRVDSP